MNSSLEIAVNMSGWGGGLLASLTWLVDSYMMFVYYLTFFLLVNMKYFVLQASFSAHVYPLL